MAHEFLIEPIEPAHSEAQFHIHSQSPEEVVAGHATSQASWTHERTATPNGGLYIGRYSSHSVFVHRQGIRAGLNRASNLSRLLKKLGDR